MKLTKEYNALMYLIDCKIDLKIRQALHRWDEDQKHNLNQAENKFKQYLKEDYDI